MATISDRTPAVTVEYDARGKRATKHFEDANEAKRFYAAKMKAGKNPTVAGEQAAAVTEPEPDPETQELSDAVNEAAEANPAPARVKLGVAPNAKTRAYYAGRAIAAAGHAAGVGAAIVDEIDREFGKPNAVESEICARNAWHAIRGYCEAAGIPLPAPGAASPADATA